MMKGKDYIRIYTGDNRIRNAEGEITESRFQDAIYGDEALYQTLNVLMYQGLESELARIKDKIEFNFELIRKPKEILDIMLGMYNEILQQEPNKAEVMTYRIDRMATVKQLEEGHTKSFFSTSKERYQAQFAYKAEPIAMEIKILPGVFYADLESLLKSEYCKGEREILIPPFTPIVIEKAAKEIQVPMEVCGVYKVVVMPQRVRSTYSKEDRVKMREIVLDDKAAETAAEALGKLQTNARDEELERAYMKWKSALQELIRMEYEGMLLSKGCAEKEK